VILHHEIVQSAIPMIWQVIAYGCLAINAIVFYTRRLVRWVRRGRA
jgi:hypothetical protein